MQAKSRSAVVGWASFAIVGALVAVSTMNVAVFVYGRINDQIRPITPASLELRSASVQLGDMKIAEERDVEVVIVNRSGRTLTLDKPDPDCGCIAPTLTTSDLAPGESSRLKFRYRAPTKPGNIQKSIALRTLEKPDVSWRVTVRGFVQADIWSEPSLIQAELEPGTPFETIVAVRYVDGVQIGEIKADDPRITVEARQASDKIQPLTLRIDPSFPGGAAQGSGTVSVFDARTKAPIHRIPVSWSPRPKIRCVPQTLNLTDYGRRGDLERSVVVLSSVRSGFDSLDVTSLAPWVRIVGREQNDQGLLLRLAFDPSSMPEKLDHEVLRLSMEGSPGVGLKAIGGR